MAYGLKSWIPKRPKSMIGVPSMKTYENIYANLWSQTGILILSYSRQLVISGDPAWEDLPHFLESWFRMSIASPSCEGHKGTLSVVLVASSKGQGF